MAERLPLFINGKFVDSESNETLPVRDPATQEVLAELPFASQKEVDQAVASAKDTFNVWRETPTPERARLMLRYQDLLKQHQNDIAKILSRETARPLRTPKAMSGGALKWWSTPAASPA